MPSLKLIPTISLGQTRLFNDDGADLVEGIQKLIPLSIIVENLWRAAVIRIRAQLLILVTACGGIGMSL